MYVHELPHQSHMQLYAVRYQYDSLRKEFEKVKKERSIFEKECEQLQRELKTAQKQKAEIEWQYLEQQLKQVKDQQSKGTHRYMHTQAYFSMQYLSAYVWFSHFYALYFMYTALEFHSTHTQV